MSTIFFHETRQTYYHRSYVPKAVRQLFHDRFEVRRSLDSTNKEEVEVRAALWDARIKRLFILKKDGHWMTQVQVDSARRALAGLYIGRG